MGEKLPMFNVVIDDDGVIIQKIPVGGAGYDEALAQVIYRERDAIKLFQEKRGGDFTGTYSFQALQNAKTFAMLQLKAQEQAVNHNLDCVQSYDGTAACSADKERAHRRSA